MVLMQASGRLSRPAAATAGLVAVLAACASCASAPSAGRAHVPSAEAKHLALVATREDGSVPASIDSLALRDSNGRKVTLASFKGKVVVISDSMTLCSEDCPLDTANVVSAAKRADAAGLTHDVEFLTVTVDPSRDTPRRLRAYRAMYTPPSKLPNWRLLTGSQADLTRLWKYFGVYWKRVPEDSPPDTDWMTGKPLTYDIEHADEVLVLDTRSHERDVISGHADVPEAASVPGRMRHYLSDEGQKHLHKPGRATWTPTDVTTVISQLTGHGIPTTS
jgi:protein SCO1/2